MSIAPITTTQEDRLNAAYSAMKLDRADAYRRAEALGGSREPLDQLVVASAALLAPTADITISTHGSVTVLQLNTDAARSWVEESVEVPGWAWMGRDRFGVDHRAGFDLAFLADDAGLEVEA
jgi:hypothetical protein